MRLRWRLLILGLVACSQRKPTRAATAEMAVVPAPAHVPAAPPPRAQPEKPPPEDRQTRIITRMLRRVSSARQLESTKSVPGIFLSRDDLIARVRAHVSREVPHEAIRQ